MRALAATARRAGAALVEDAAEAHGARDRGRPVGSLGDVACFSFYGNKMVTTGEGGMVLTSDPELAARLRLAARSRDVVEAALLPRGDRLQLSHDYASGGARPRATRSLRRHSRSQTKDRRLVSRRPARPAAGARARRCRVARTSTGCSARCSLEARDSIATPSPRRLRARGIDSRPFFVPIPELPPYRGRGTYPVAADLAARGLNLPSASAARAPRRPLRLR